LTIAPDIEAAEASLLDPERRRLARRSLSILGVLSIGSMTGSASSLYLVNHYPLLLIALSPLGRHLVLVAPIAHPLAFVLVGVLRRGAFYLACFQLGHALGPAGVHWLEERAARFARFVRWVESLFQKAPRLVVLVGAGPTVSMLAGMAGMSTATFVPLAAASLVFRMLLILAFGEIMRSPIEWILAWIDEYWVPGTAVLVLATLVYQWWRVRRSRARRAI
jgi:membrane protein DedA with SNARE-associated domain